MTGCQTDYLQKLGKLVYNIGKRRDESPDFIQGGPCFAPAKQTFARICRGVKSIARPFHAPCSDHASMLK